MNNDFKNELLVLTNSFLFENDTQKGEFLKKIKQLIRENVESEIELKLINNLLDKKYNNEISNFCSSDGSEHAKLMLSVFAMIFSILSLPE